jgi:hypothetical protein
MREACHDCDIFIVDAVVVDRRLQQVRILFEPLDGLELFYGL